MSTGDLAVPARYPGGHGLIVATERLGWPGKGDPWWARWGIFQGRMRFDDDPEATTATCHLQVAAEEPALCGYPWEGLIDVPGNAAWEGLDDWLRCDACEAVSLGQVPWPTPALTNDEPTPPGAESGTARRRRRWRGFRGSSRLGRGPDRSPAGG